jgi:serine/threonine protein kinase
MADQVFGGRWEIREPLPEGGQAHTFRVVDQKGDKKTSYASKRLKNVKRLERFRSEVEALRSAAHQNLVKLIDFDLGVDSLILSRNFVLQETLMKKTLVGSVKILFKS